MERKKRSKDRGWESCYVKKIYGTFGVEMRAYGQKLVQFCKHTHTHTHAAKLVVEIYVCMYQYVCARMSERMLTGQTSEFVYFMFVLVDEKKFMQIDCNFFGQVLYYLYSRCVQRIVRLTHHVYGTL